jgi:hypothetical protein
MVNNKIPFDMHTWKRAQLVAHLLRCLVGRDRGAYETAREAVINVYGYDTFWSLQSAAFRCIGNADGSYLGKLIKSFEDLIHYHLDHDGKSPAYDLLHWLAAMEEERLAS